MSLHRELKHLFGPSICSQAQTIRPEAVDVIAVNEAVGALLLLKGRDAEQFRYVSAMNPKTAVALCRWMSDPSFWVLVGAIAKQ